MVGEILSLGLSFVGLVCMCFLARPNRDNKEIMYKRKRRARAF